MVITDEQIDEALGVIDGALRMRTERWDRRYEHALDRLREGGMRFARVGTGLDPAHAPARRAYKKAGFSIQLPSVEYYRRA
jgi:hypothetical protein